MRNAEITLERVEEVLQDATSRPASDPGFPLVWDAFIEAPRPWSHRQRIHFSNPHERLDAMKAKCTELFGATSDSEEQSESLDEIWSQQMICNFNKCTRLTGLKQHEYRHEYASVTREAQSLIQRFPATTVQLPEYGEQHASQLGTPLLRSWEDMQISWRLDTNVVRLVLASKLGSSGYMSLPKFIDTTAEMLEVASSLTNDAQSLSASQRWLIVRGFLWSSWQRVAMLWFHIQLGFHLGESGYRHDYMNYSFLRHTSPAPGLSTEKYSQQLSRTGKVEYMCTWALELLCSEPSCIVCDFRLLHERYSTLFRDRSARCIAGSEYACDGGSPDRCQRFKGMKGVLPQSSHDSSCSGDCAKLCWDETSYREERGARAVDLHSTNAVQGSQVLKYCRPSDRTLTISHVWIHGQGGRPEDGMNVCLHQRYSAVAQAIGCDSYWMDTPCIPSDHMLRMEAIRGINPVFSGSFATLVCDRDLMDIDLGGLDFDSDAPLEKAAVQRGEEILATLLVCDWNVRAWTFLESIKGRRNILLLCKNNRTVSFQQLLAALHKCGNLSIGSLALHSPHLLPTVPYNKQSRNQASIKADDSNIQADDAGLLLSRRPASRPGDDLVIWSLLVKDVNEVYDSPVDFWRSRQQTPIRTGFLMSSAPRLKQKGLSWAPKSPQALSRAEQGSNQDNGANVTGTFFRAFDGVDTEPGQITPKGFVANWVCFHFPCAPLHGSMDELPTQTFYNLPGSLFKNFCISKTRSSWLRRYPSDCAAELERIRRRFLRFFRFGVLLQPIAATNSDNDVSFALEPTCANYSQASGFSNERAARYRGQIDGTLVAVCGTNGTYGQSKSDHERYGTVNNFFCATNPIWTWRGVHKWPKDISLPPFFRDSGVIIG